MKKIFVTFAVIMLLFGMSYAAMKEVKIAVVINAESALAKDLDAEGVKKIYLGKTVYIGGEKITPLNQRDTDVYSAFLEKFIGQTPSAYKNYWVKQVFATGLAAPEVKDTNEEVLKYIGENKNAVGYVPEEALKGREKMFKVISVK